MVIYLGWKKFLDRIVLLFSIWSPVDDLQCLNFLNVQIYVLIVAHNVFKLKRWTQHFCLGCFVKIYIQYMYTYILMAYSIIQYLNLQALTFSCVSNRILFWITLCIAWNELKCCILPRVFQLGPGSKQFWNADLV